MSNDTLFITAGAVLILMAVLVSFLAGYAIDALYQRKFIHLVYLIPVIFGLTAILVWGIYLLYSVWTFA